MLEVDELSLGQSIHTELGEDPFRGQVSRSYFQGILITSDDNRNVQSLESSRHFKKRGETLGNSDQQGEQRATEYVCFFSINQLKVKNSLRKTKSPAVSFTNITGYVTFSPHRVTLLKRKMFH